MQQLVFVLGEDKGITEHPWSFFHLDPYDDVTVGEFKLVFFDYPAGELKTWNRWLPKRGDDPGSPPDRIEPIAPQIQIQFSDGTLDTEPRGSVLALYDYIKAQPTESVRSLQVFGHGDYDGPILFRASFEHVNDTTLKEDLSAPRDPNDSEFRRRDFRGPNPLAAGGLSFRESFSADAFVKIWGCQEERQHRKAVSTYLQNAKREDREAESRALLNLYLDTISETFPMGLARVLGVPVWAAPLGWGSNQWGGLDYKGNFPPDLDSERWWRIPSFRQGRSFGKHRRFYEKVLGAPVDATGFVGYDSRWFETARAKVATEQAPGLIPSPRDLQDQLAARVPG